MTSPAKTNDQNNRRSSVRSCVGLRVRACQGQHSVELRTSDVSTGGARLELAEHHEFRIGEDLDLELHVPGVAHPVKVSGEVRWGAAHACGVRFRAFAEKAGAAVLATFLATMPAGVSAKSAIPEFDPDNFTVDLNQYPGDKTPDEARIMKAFESQYGAFDECVFKVKSKQRSTRIEGLAEMKVLLNPRGATPLGLHARMPEQLEKTREGVKLRDCLREAVGSAPYPGYDGPPVVVDFEFEIDPGDQLEQ